MERADRVGRPSLVSAPLLESSSMNSVRILAIATLACAFGVDCCLASPTTAEPVCCARVIPAVAVVAPIDETPREPSWIFAQSTYSHDPTNGARVAQYERKPPVEPLEDERNITSRYRRTRTNLRGADGSYDTYYQVQAWGNGRGGLDAEWERFHDAWKESILSGGYYNGSAYGPYRSGGYGGPGGGYGYGNPGSNWGAQGPVNGGWNSGNWNAGNGGGWHGGRGPHGGGAHGKWPRDHQNGHDD